MLKAVLILSLLAFILDVNGNILGGEIRFILNIIGSCILFWARYIAKLFWIF